MISGSNASNRCVSSRANTTPVKGERMTPPRTPARPMSAQKPGPTTGKRWASTVPSAPPIMNIGASTPPDVPEPSDSDQISVLTTKIPATTPRPMEPSSSAPITL